MSSGEAPSPFHRIGPNEPASPVVISVPHAGRNYGPALLRAARVPLATLETLEDRLVDRLIWRAVATGATAFVAYAPRAEIDLNRDERELDPATIAPAPRASEVITTARTRGGLGLVPSRVPGSGALWRGRLERGELDRRISTIHRPYHDALAAALAAARVKFGVAVLIDCHSMPPRPAGAPRIVLGDRHGASAGPQIVAAASAAVREQGHTVTLNDPYAGGYVVERHGAPAREVHALQVEIDRAAYLAPGLREPGAGFDEMARLLAAICDAVAWAALGGGEALAAE